MYTQRTTERESLIYYLEVTDLHSQKVAGHIVDISRDGMRLVSNKPILNNEVHQFSVKLPRELGNTAPINVSVRSVWSASDINPSLFDTGFSFEWISAGNQTKISQLIERYKF